jgi:hypothetical protein
LSGISKREIIFSLSQNHSISNLSKIPITERIEQLIKITFEYIFKLVLPLFKNKKRKMLK